MELPDEAVCQSASSIGHWFWTVLVATALVTIITTSLAVACGARPWAVFAAAVAPFIVIALGLWLASAVSAWRR